MEYTTTFQFARLVNQINKLENLASQASKRMGDAAEQGDLRENAEFQYAEENRNSDLLKSARLKHQLQTYQLFFEDQISTKCIGIGNTVKVKDLIDNSFGVFNIVGSGPSDIEKDEVPYLSPIGDGLCGMELEEIKEIRIPAGIRKYKILEISKYYPKE